jgi:S1-C subfamily serine protease
VGGDFATNRCVISPADIRLTAVPGIRPFADLRAGERVYAVGAPSGLGLTYDERLISGKRQADGLDYVQISVPFPPGSSGGGLFDSRGNLIGITSFLQQDLQSLRFAMAADSYWR